MFGSAPCILDTRHEFHSISVGGGLFIVGVARGVADLHAERSRRRSPMDEGQCERAGPVVSEGQEGGVDLHYNQSDPSEPIQVSAHQNQNLTQTQLDDGQRVGCDSIEHDSLNGNRDEEEEEDDDVIVEEEKDSVTAPDTPMTDSSFSDTGSLVELHPSVSPETTCPISPVAGSPDEPSYSNPEGKTHTSTTEPTTSTTEPTTSTTEPTTSTTEPTTSTTEPTTSITEPTGPTSTTEPTTSTTEPSTTLLASLQELGERKDHSHLPQSLHQVCARPSPFYILYFYLPALFSSKH
ncbi:mucin-2-like [Salvelinus namaycush]|uniref:Mucin-2-like n=1 Tax=Salvelinus namaycush TaxID=8040 RepID=A0A8U1GVM8_SALNM|nr:mucin-2-like [Salvelinus namaycush]